MKPAGRHYGAVGALAWGLVVLELAYARTVSVAMVAHFATAVVSLALLGVGVGGLLVRRFPGSFPATAVDRQLPKVMTAFGAAAILSDVMFLEHLSVPDVGSPHAGAWVAAIALVLAVPFVLGGLAVTMLMTHCARDLGRMSATRFAGAAAGYVGGVVILGVLPGPPAPVVVAAVVCWAALLFAADAGGSMRIPAGGCVLVLLFAQLGAAQPHVLHLLHVRRWTEPYTEYDAWNAGSRIGVFPSAPGTSAAQTLPLARPADAYTAPRPPDFKWLDVDGTGWTPMLHYDDGNLAPLAFLRDSVVYAAHHLRHDARVLVVGLGGGRDLVAARAFGQPTVLALEPNPLVRDAVGRRFAYFSGVSDALPGVRVLGGDVRGTLAGLDDVFDVIQLGPDTGGATRRFAALDGYRYTREAFVEYFRHLAPGGVLSVTRALVAEYPFEVLRSLATVRAAWAAAGVAEPARHVVVLAQDLSATVLAKREPFSADELAAIDRLATERRFVVRYDPRRASDDDAATLGVDAGALADAGVDVRPATDDRPFFLQFLHSPAPRLPPDPMGLLGEAQDALRTTQTVLLLALAFAAAALRWGRLGRAGEVAADGGTTLLLGFVALAVAVTVVSTSVLQWLALLLGSPPAALVLGGGPLLVASAAGAMAGARAAAPRRAAIGAAAALAALAACEAIALPKVVGGLLGAPGAVKAGVALVAAAAPGVVAGAAWTLALTAVRERGTTLVAGALGLDGIASVVATTLATTAAERVGFSVVLAGGALAGVGAAALIAAATRPALALDAVPDAAVGS